MSVRVLFVFEFPPAGDEMARSLIASLRARRPELEFRSIHGLFHGYRPGGLTPRRLINFLWVYLRVACELPFARVDAVIVRSTPPGVQLWTQWWARFRRIPVICWLMDYHPEIEARRLEQRGWPAPARWLRQMDARIMPGFSLVVVLDRAMAALARGRTAGGEVVEHPTWSGDSPGGWPPVYYAPGEASDRLRLAYSGNLGVAHDLSELAGLLREVVRRRPVSLYVVGASATGEARFRQLAAGLGIPVLCHRRVPFADLHALYEEWRIDAGVVLLTEDSAGLVSPSKFSGYINFGLPLVYVGPPDNNTADVCVRFRGGFWIPSRAGSEQITAVADALLDPQAMAAAAAGAREAAAHFAGLNSESLAAIIARRIPGVPRQPVNTLHQAEVRP